MFSGHPHSQGLTEIIIFPPFLPNVDTRMKHCLCCQVASQAEKGKCAWPEESSGHGPGMLHPAKVALSSEQLLWPRCTRTHLLAPGPGHGGDEPLGAHVALSPHQGRVQLWDWCWWEAAGWPDTSLHICLCLCPSARNGSCTSLPISCPQLGVCVPGDGGSKSCWPLASPAPAGAVRGDPRATQG